MGLSWRGGRGGGSALNCACSATYGGIGGAEPAQFRYNSGAIMVQNLYSFPGDIDVYVQRMNAYGFAALDSCWTVGRRGVPA